MANWNGGLLEIGDAVPWFRAQLLRGPVYSFEGIGGFINLMLFYGSAARAPAAAALQAVERRRHLFDDKRGAFFGFTVDPEDERAARIQVHVGVHHFLDFDARLSRLCGAATDAEGGTGYRPHWLLIDRAMRVIGRFPLEQAEQAIDAYAQALAPAQPPGQAPVLAVDNVMDPAFCQQLIALYEEQGGVESGFMRQIGDKTVGVHDFQHKRRKDHVIEDETVREAIRRRLVRHLLPMIERAFQYRATRIERYIIACYEGETGGHFAPHRDNTTAGTAHRRFAVTINLNGDFDGGELCFPEFGSRTYRAPPGGAIVFSCSLMHQATRVTAGRRYATLPFLYDDAAADIRAANRDMIEYNAREPDLPAAVGS